MSNERAFENVLMKCADKSLVLLKNNNNNNNNKNGRVLECFISREHTGQASTVMTSSFLRVLGH
jgi:hypothetical protein